MQLNKPLCAAKCCYILVSLLFGALGGTLIAMPDFSISLLCLLGGTLLICFGFVKILGYLSNDLYRLAFQHDLAFGILLFLLGLFLILHTGTSVSIVCLLFSLFILADSLLKIQIALDSKAFGLKFWWLILASAAVAVLFGLILLFHTQDAKAMLLLGLAFLGEGVLNLITVMTAVRILQKKRPVPPEA